MCGVESTMTGRGTGQAYNQQPYTRKECYTLSHQRHGRQAEPNNQQSGANSGPAIRGLINYPAYSSSTSQSGSTHTVHSNWIQANSADSRYSLIRRSRQAIHASTVNSQRFIAPRCVQNQNRHLARLLSLDLYMP